MARAFTETQLSYRSQEQRPARSMSLARWITVQFLLIIGLMLWSNVLSDASGHLWTPSIASILYVVAVIGVVGFLAYTDRNRDSCRKNRKYRLRYEGRRNGTTK